mmetsp:Transcript_8938/g.22468  ORF Transcript_8938/g.22468 Transcript_8938/m.22468 type:complete len:138 (+) Transcript_8938:41-454(+)|eukprot:CAMPEP_0177656510 /NCGR_PEP_ID=MMETSP0447-20121125/15612_1 /TAXON_ID=0 /ORGANISM="Stygamoeba regulata, Strain BSH-02190019" /LENGTH=137 /DNA_ID=CAMNT_0019160647 /DNA_START=182 /DNA_END=595 /DNA_ORIENTATION=+
MSWSLLGARSVLGGAALRRSAGSALPAPLSSVDCTLRATKKKKGGKGGGTSNPVAQLEAELANLPVEQRIQALFVQPDPDMPTRLDQMPDWVVNYQKEFKPFTELTPTDKKYHKVIRRKKIKDHNLSKSRYIKNVDY